eukprot:gb/GEZN01005854.1/.p1 GENE.gb/GEZN01005854.1/~~gb/GEZN01005854.1/.p1  ORF type:complete len:573 (-),score=113.59 gb/GEZN01005854.1/:25-1611(-)
MQQQDQLKQENPKEVEISAGHEEQDGVAFANNAVDARADQEAEAQQQQEKQPGPPDPAQGNQDQETQQLKGPQEGKQDLAQAQQGARSEAAPAQGKEQANEGAQLKGEQAQEQASEHAKQPIAQPQGVNTGMYSNPTGKYSNPVHEQAKQEWEQKRTNWQKKQGVPPVLQNPGGVPRSGAPQPSKSKGKLKETKEVAEQGQMVNIGQQPQQMANIAEASREHDDYGHGEVQQGDGLIHHGSHTHTKEETLRDTGYIFSVMIAVMIGAQLLLYAWQKLHPSTYKLFTLLGIWIAPIAWGYSISWYKVEVVWGTITVISGYIVWLATRTPLAKSTPRTVYAWLRFLYKVNTTMLFGGNSLVMLDFVGVPLFVLGWPTGKMSLYGWWFCFVGLYFGLLLRDFSDVCSSRMASTMGYYSKDGMPSRQLMDGVCAICDDEMPRDHELAAKGVKLFKLGCGHRFHESCLRGWTVIGKKEVCPACMEKVDMKHLQGAFWETFSGSANCILDWLREMVVFTPCIIILTKFLLVLVY